MTEDSRFARLLAATASLDTPFALVDEEALWANAAGIVRRAGGKPVRLATKSVRVRSIIRSALTIDGFQGVMSYSLPESIWLAECGIDDILLAYPSVNREAILQLAAEDYRLDAITVMVDSLDHLDFISSTLGAGHPTIRVCLDVDASYRRFGIHAGVHRSPVHSTKEAKQLAARIVERPGFDLVGLMFYDAQIAGVGDDSAMVRGMKRRSAKELTRRRRKITRAVKSMTELDIVNTGGTGSLHIAASDPNVTELTAGSGLFSPTSFDNRRGFSGTPAAFFASSVVRKPEDDIVTVFGGGYLASGPADDSRVPLPVWPDDLYYLRREGAGEVQTPLHGASARGMKIGDRVLFRHAKAGELCERFDEIALVAPGGQIVRTPTYRGEHMNFG